MLTAAKIGEIRRIQNDIAKSQERERYILGELEDNKRVMEACVELENERTVALASERGWRRVQEDKLGRELLALAKIVEEQAPKVEARSFCSGRFTDGGVGSIACGQIAGCGLAGCPVGS